MAAPEEALSAEQAQHGAGESLGAALFPPGRRNTARLKLLNAIAALDYRRLSFYLVATRWLAFGPPRA